MTILNKELELPKGMPQGKVFYDDAVATSPHADADPCGLVISPQGEISHLVIPPGSKQARKFAELIEHHPKVAHATVPVPIEGKTYYLIPKQDRPSLKDFLAGWLLTEPALNVLPESDVLDRINKIHADAPQRLAAVLPEWAENLKYGEIERSNAKSHLLAAVNRAELDQLDELGQEAIPPIFQQLPPDLLPALAKYYADLYRRNEQNAAKGGPNP